MATATTMRHKQFRPVSGLLLALFVGYPALAQNNVTTYLQQNLLVAGGTASSPKAQHRLGLALRPAILSAGSLASQTEDPQFMLRDLQKVGDTFLSSAPSSSAEAVRDLIKFSFEDPVSAEEGAARAIHGRKSEMSIWRQVIVLQISQEDSSALTDIAGIVTSFERSAKPQSYGDYYFEYEDPQSLSASQILATKGAPDSFTAAARPQIIEGQAVPLKKCIKVPILGFYCNTSLYELMPQASLSDSQQVRIFQSHQIDLGAAVDNSKMDKSQRRNYPDSSSSTYLLVRNQSQVLVYNLGIQYLEKGGDRSRESAIHAGHLKEFSQLRSRIDWEVKQKNKAWQIVFPR